MDMIYIMMTTQVLVRLDEELNRKLENLARMLGVSRAEVIRMALREFLREEKKTKKMRGLIKSKLSLDQLEEMYQVGR